jgi:hypothetical protein
MRNAISPNDFKTKRRAYGDVAILHGIFTSKIFKMLFTNSGEAYDLIILQWLRFNSNCLSYAMRGLLNYNYGTQNMGFCIVLVTLAIGCAFNSNHIYMIFSPFVVWLLPVILCFQDLDTIYSWIFIDIKSKALLGWMILLSLSSIVHIGRVYTGNGNHDVMSRGESIIGFFLTKFFAMSRFARFQIRVNPFAVSLLECGLFIGLGYFTWDGDTTFSLFCFLTSINELIYQVRTKSAEMHREGYMNS